VIPSASIGTTQWNEYPIIKNASFFNRTAECGDGIQDHIVLVGGMAMMSNGSFVLLVSKRLGAFCSRFYSIPCMLRVVLLTAGTDHTDYAI